MIMTFLMKLWLLLKRLFQSRIKEDEVIPLNIKDDEIIVRGLFHPLHISVSKNRLKHTAFLPGDNSSDVSTNRLCFSTPSKCKNIVKTVTMNGQTYRGLSTIRAVDITSADQDQGIIVTGISVTIKATPIDNAGHYRSDKKVRVADEGNPTHSDIKYSEPYQKNEPNTGFRMIAQKITKKAKMFIDPSPENDIWEGPNLM